VVAAAELRRLRRQLGGLEDERPSGRSLLAPGHREGRRRDRRQDSFNLTIHNSADNAPFTGTSIFLTRRRTATFPNRGLSIVGRAGQNCPGTCSVGQVGAIRSPLSGRVYVNVAVVVKDHEGSTNATASCAGNLTVMKR